MDPIQRNIVIVVVRWDLIRIAHQGKVHLLILDNSKSSTLIDSNDVQDESLLEII